MFNIKRLLIWHVEFRVYFRQLSETKTHTRTLFVPMEHTRCNNHFVRNEQIRPMTCVYWSVHIGFASIFSHQGSPKNSIEGATLALFRARKRKKEKETEVNLQAGRREQLRPDQRNLRSRILRSCTNLIRPMRRMQNDGNCPACISIPRNGVFSRWRTSLYRNTGDQTLQPDICFSGLNAEHSGE